MDGIGSTWGRWDLHIHSPLSIEQDYGGDTPAVWEKYLTALESLPPDVVAIGINDYYFLDGYLRVAQAKRDNNRLPNIKKIFPVIEFRVSTFASASSSSLSKVNIHFLFDIDEKNLEKSVNEIRQNFIEQIHLAETGELKNTPLTRQTLIDKSPEKTLKSGFASFIPNTEVVLNLVQSAEWRDKIITILGFKEWNELEKNNQVKPHKTLLSKDTSAYFTAGNILGHHEKKIQILEQFGARPLIHSGDIHSFEKLTNDYDCLTWFRAIPSFRGLQQSLKENQRRIVLGTLPSDLKAKNTNKHNLVSRLTYEVSNLRIGGSIKQVLLQLMMG
jgi:hypothetical protein